MSDLQFTFSGRETLLQLARKALPDSAVINSIDRQR